MSAGMSDTSQVQELPFQAEVQQVLQLVIGSLYANREIFLRELISNATDAIDKARFLAVTNKDIASPAEHKISLSLDSETKTLTIEDTGIGLTREEAIKNLGTIAHSGSMEFLKAHADAMKANAGASPNIIGQFGVGFYSAFMVASRIDVESLSIQPGAEAIVWRSSASGTFTVAPGTRTTPGTRITLHLKDDAKEFAESFRVRGIVKKYSDFTPFPIHLNGEVIGRGQALWTMPKSQITGEQYDDLYRHIVGHPTETPLTRLHHSVEAPLQFHALLYVPEHAGGDLFQPDYPGLRLFAKRVLILEDCKKLLPTYLRFVRGLVDSEDLNLNVSRELLQEDRSLRVIEQTLTKQLLKHLTTLATDSPETYTKFWAEYGRILKEGVHTDHKNREDISELLRFESSRTKPGESISLASYVQNMPEGQSEIYYLTGPSRASLEVSPHLEIFKKKGFEVLLLTDPIDEWVVSALNEYKSKPLTSVAHGEVKFKDDEPPAETPESTLPNAIAALKEALRDRASDVRVSKRLVETSCCLVNDEGQASAHLERILRELDKSAKGESKRILEVNPNHPILKNMETLASTDPSSPRLKLWAEALFDQAMLAEGTITDPAEFARRLQSLLTEATASV